MLMLQLYRSQFKFVYQITRCSVSPMCRYLSGRIAFFRTVCSILRLLTLTIAIVALHFRLAGDFLKTVISIKT